MNWSEFQWTRILAFFSGVAIVIVFFSINLYWYLPDFIVSVLFSLPVGLCLYGVTNQSWKTVLGIMVGVGIGMGLGTYLDTTGFHLF